MQSPRRILVVLLLSVLLIFVSALPALAETSDLGLFTANISDCSIIISGIVPDFGGQTSPERNAVGDPVMPFYVLIYDDGVELLSIYIANPQVGDLLEVSFLIDEAIAGKANGVGIYLDFDGDANNGVFDYIDPFMIPDEVFERCVATTCPYPLTVGAIQGRLEFATQVYHSPSLQSLTTVTLPAGSSWFVVDGQNGFYKLFIACQAHYVWVPAEAMGPNFDAVWGGRSLPSAGNLPSS